MKKERSTTLSMLIIFMFISIVILFSNKSNGYYEEKNILENIEVRTEEEFKEAISSSSGDIKIKVLNNLDLDSGITISNKINSILLESEEPIVILSKADILFKLEKNSDIEINLNKNVNFKGIGEGSNTFLNVVSNSKVSLKGNNSVIENFNSTYQGGAISSFGDLNIEGIIFRKNNSTYNGGAIYSSGKLSIKDTLFIENKSRDGGAIYLDNFEVDIIGGLFEKNEAQTGGAIHSSSKLNINGTMFLENEAKIGGGINLNYSTLNIIEGIFKGNIAESGGAISSIGGNFVNNGITFKVKDSSFEENKAIIGGAIEVRRSNKEIVVTDDERDYNLYDYMEISNTEFKDNFASYGIFELRKEDYPKIYKIYEKNIKVNSLSYPADINNKNHLAYNNYDVSFIGIKNIEEPIEPEKPIEIIKDITLVGGRATLTDKMRSELSNFKQHELYGKDRYATSVQVSKAYKNSDTIVLASGEKYTDELTATVLASKLDVPILLSEKDVVQEVVMKEIERLGATRVILIGEKGTLSKSVETQLSKYKLERIGGVDRYETAVLIGDQVRTITGNKTQSILVDGTNFPDAIAMTSMGVEQGLPIILTQPNELNKITEKAVKDWGITKVTIGGGTASVSSNIESTLKATVEVERIKGTDRYETSVLVAKQVYKNPTHAVVASGEVFPDAIVGAPYAAKNKYPIVLSRGNSVPQVVLNYVNGK